MQPYKSFRRAHVWLFWSLALMLLACSFFRATPAALQGVEPPAPELVIRNVTVFPGNVTVPVAAQDVWVRGGRINYVGPTGVRPVSPTAVIVEGAGRTLLPGLIDLHVHVLGSDAPPWNLKLPNAERTLQALLFAGITTIADLGGALGETVTLRDRVAKGELLGPRMFVTGPHITAVNGHPVAMVDVFVPALLGWLVKPSLGTEVATPKEAIAAVDERVENGADFIKITSDAIPLAAPRLAPQLAAAVVARAHGRGKKVFAHVGTNEDVWRVVTAGVDVLAHGIYKEGVTEGTARLLAEKKVPVIVTLAVFDSLDRLVSGDYESLPLAQFVSDAETLRSYRERPDDFVLPEPFRDYLARLQAVRQARLDNIAVLRRHGVVVLVGSDSPNVGNPPGAAFHRELDLLVAAGMPPAAVLAAATYGNANVLGLSHVGAIQPGYQADLLLVEGDPLAHIANIHRIVAVYQDGRLVKR